MPILDSTLAFVSVASCNSSLVQAFLRRMHFLTQPTTLTCPHPRFLAVVGPSAHSCIIPAQRSPHLSGRSTQRTTFNSNLRMPLIANLLFSTAQKVSVFAGGRFGKLDQDFLQSGVFSGGLGGAINTTSHIDFTGGGPIIGIDAERRIDSSGFSVYGHALAASLLGKVHSDYRMFNTTTSTLLADAAWDNERVMPMIDYELGLAWTGPQGHLHLAAGYMVNHWFNAVTTPVFIDAVQANNYTDLGDTISFTGLVGRLSFTW